MGTVGGPWSTRRSRRRAQPGARGTRLVWVGAALAALPVVLALAVVAGTRWYPTGDMAQAELHVRGIWSHPPLVGAAGGIADADGFQGSHPGPSLWFAMYPVCALLGRSSFGLMAGAVSVHLVSFAVALLLAPPSAAASLIVLVTLALVVLVRASGPFFFLEPWNPWLAVFPFLVFLLAVWGLADGDRWMAPLAVLAGAHTIQSHTGYRPRHRIARRRSSCPWSASVAGPWGRSSSLVWSGPWSGCPR
ncbi:MAG: hypothetical protein R2705_00055 [Ilumatobacteraceae bacterium]